MNGPEPSVAAGAADLYFGLLFGLDTPADAVRWAERTIMLPNHPYDDDVADVALADGRSAAKVMELLTPLFPESERWPAVRRILGRIARRLNGHPEDAGRFADALFALWRDAADRLATRRLEGEPLPDDLSFFSHADELIWNAEFHGGEHAALEEFKELLRPFDS